MSRYGEASERGASRVQDQSIVVKKKVDGGTIAERYTDHDMRQTLRRVPQSSKTNEEKRTLEPTMTMLAMNNILQHDLVVTMMPRVSMSTGDARKHDS